MGLTVKNPQGGSQAQAQVENYSQRLQSPDLYVHGGSLTRASTLDVQICRPTLSTRQNRQLSTLKRANHSLHELQSK